MILEVCENRLLPLASREYTVDYCMPEPSAGLTLKTRVRYHILTEGQHGILKEQYGLTGNESYALTIYERDLPLSAGVTALLREQETGRLIRDWLAPAKPRVEAKLDQTDEEEERYGSSIFD